MKDFKIKLVWSTSDFLAWVVFAIGIGLCIVNCKYIIKLESTIETMWHEIVQVKETNIGLYQFIEEHKNDFD